jgi:hypothetical protein
MLFLLGKKSEFHLIPVLYFCLECLGNYSSQKELQETHSFHTEKMGRNCCLVSLIRTHTHHYVHAPEIEERSGEKYPRKKNQRRFCLYVKNTVGSTKRLTLKCSWLI